MLVKFAAALAAALVVGQGAALAADDPKGFVRNQVALGQTLDDLLQGEFFEEVRCLEKCVVSTRLVVAPADAAELGLERKWFEIGRVERRTLRANVWTQVHIPLNKRGRAALKDAEGGVKIYGQTVASSLVSGRKGWASWIRTCKWPRR
jgi:hypothetical protein